MRNLLLAVYLTLPTVVQAVTSECTLQKGDQNSILTCTFSEEVNTLNRNIKIVRRTGLNTVSAALCHWSSGKPNCQIASGFQLAGTITNIMTIIIINSSLVDNGIYSCRLLQLNVSPDNFGECNSTQKSIRATPSRWTQLTSPVLTVGSKTDGTLTGHMITSSSTGATTISSQISSTENNNLTSLIIIVLGTITSITIVTAALLVVCVVILKRKRGRLLERSLARRCRRSQSFRGSTRSRPHNSDSLQIGEELNVLSGKTVAFQDLQEDDVGSGDEEFARYIRQSNGMDSLYLTGRASERTLKRAACLRSATEGTGSFKSQLSNIESEPIYRPDYLDLNNEPSDQKGTDLMSILQSKDKNLKVSGGEDRGKISHSDYTRLESDSKRDVHNYDSLGKELTPARDNVGLWFWCWYQAFILQNIVFGATGAGRALPNRYSPFSHLSDVSTLGGTGRMTVSPEARQNLNNRLNAPNTNPESQDEEDTDYIIFRLIGY